MSNPAGDQYGWIGLGNKGLAMATNLQTHLASHSAPGALQFTNRTISRGESLIAMGAVACATPAEVVEKSGIIFLSLSDDSAVRSTIDGIIQAHSSLTGKLLVDTSTVSPKTTTYINDQMISARGAFLAAPVFGATPVAVAGQLLFALAGPSSSIERVRPIISACLARSIIVAGPSQQDATLLKTTGNFITAGMAEVLSEAHVLAEKAGLDSAILHALIQENYGAYAASISDKLVQGFYAPPKGERPRSDVKLAVKDVQTGVDVAAEVSANLPLGDFLMSRLVQARAWGERNGRNLDSSSVYGIARTEAGLGFERFDVLEQRRQS